MLESIIKKNRPNLAQSSIKTYLSSLSRITKDVKVELKTPEDFIKNIDAILEKAKDYTPIVRKSKLASIIVLLDDKDGLEDTGEYKDKDKTDAIKKLRFVMQKDMKTVDDEETKSRII